MGANSDTDNKYILAMYDVRGKQDYIFRGKKLKEIAGGSLVIRDIFDDELFPAAVEYRKTQPALEETYPNEAIFSYKKIVEDNEFSVMKFQEHIEQGYLGEVIYDGGGNFFILYKDKDVFEGINEIFTKNVLEHTYSLMVLCSCIEGVDFNNYWCDQKKLIEENRKREARINPKLPAQVLPFTQVDYANSIPLYKYNNSVMKKLTKEANRKYEKFFEIQQDLNKKSEYDEKVLDRIVKEKGKDSWISVIYIDGNNMGAKVQAVKKESGGTYEDAIKGLRIFSDKIQKEYIDDRIKAIDDALQKKYKDEEENYKRRLVVYAGDEINIILNAHDAYDAIKAYFKEMPKEGSACAGIAIFKSHMPYSDAYRIAEQCCESGKQLMKKYDMGEVNLVDFHYCQGAIGLDLDKIREKEVGEIISKPWIISGIESTKKMEKEKIYSSDMVDEIVKRLNSCTRTNVKGLLDVAKNNESELFSELTRMQLRRVDQSAGSLTEIKIDDETLSNEKLRKLIYDIVSVYDLWFREESI